MIELAIYRRYFYGSKCYQSAPLQPVRGVQVHSTGANNPYLRRYVQPDDGRIGVNPNHNDHNNTQGTVCANAYIGKQLDGTVAIYQALPWNQRCWLSGAGPNGNANKQGYVGFEICEDAKTDESYFLQAMDAAAMLTAYLCQEYGLDPVKDVRDHNELHEMGLASNHADVTHWLKLHGENMDRFRGTVMGYMAMGIQARYIDCDEVNTMFKAKCICPGTYLNLRSGKGTAYASLARILQGDIVDVLDTDDAAWWRVQYGGITGWAMKDYLQILDESPADAQEEPEEKGRKETAKQYNTTTIETIKLKEIEACLADALSIVRAALGRTQNDVQD